VETLIEYLETEITARFWRPADLAKKAHIRDATLSRILSESRQAGPDVCNALAKALDEPPEKLFRLAGILPPSRDPGEDEEELLHHYRELDEAGQREARAVIRALRDARSTYGLGDGE